MGEGYLVLVLVIFTICRTDGASLWGREHLEKHYNLTPARREAKPDCSQDCRDDFSLCLWRFREHGKEANEWLTKKKNTQNLPLILPASETRRLELVLCLKEQCLFCNPGKQSSCTHLRARWLLFVGFGANILIFVCLTFAPSPSVCPLESL